MKMKILLACGVLAVTLAVFADEVGLIGLAIVERHNDGEPLRTQAPYKGSPADRAGIKTNGFLISVDGTNVVSMALTQAVNRVRGPVGTFVTIEIADTTMSHTNKFTVKRAKAIFSSTLDFPDQ